MVSQVEFQERFAADWLKTEVLNTDSLSSIVSDTREDANENDSVRSHDKIHTVKLTRKPEQVNEVLMIQKAETRGKPQGKVGRNR